MMDEVMDWAAGLEVPLLKQECRKRGLKVTGRKHELVARIVHHSKQEKKSNNKAKKAAAKAAQQAQAQAQAQAHQQLPGPPPEEMLKQMPPPEHDEEFLQQLQAIEQQQHMNLGMRKSHSPSLHYICQRHNYLFDRHW
eukprot:m.104686 g.104686  ORF g.104686 m.104686 type:complete len:138 (+) comp13852_c0_seq4:167-580(+)